MMLQKIKKQIKEYFSPIFDPQKRESGLVVAALVVTGVIALVGTIGWYFKAQIGKEILYGSGTLILGMARFFFKIAQGLFETVASSDILQRSITRDAMVLHGWAIVRDFANMFIVLGFVVVGIATILRIRTYEAQKTLLPLILVALLINFSLLICGIIIDTTNITMNYFTKISGPAGITTQYGALLTDPRIDGQLQTFKNTSDWENYASMCFATSMYIAIAAMIFFIYGVLLLFRYVALMCLVILSPLAFVCYVFPATKSIFSKWWQQFTQWAIIGIPTAFFIYLGGHLLQSMASQNNTTIAFWVPVGFLLFAYTLIFQTSAIGASAAIGMATGAAGFAWGATKFTGGKALRGIGEKTGITDKAKTMGGNALERIGLRSKGTTAQNAQKQMEERKKRASAQTEEQQVTSAKGRAFTPEQIRNKVANIENLAKDNKLYKVGGAKEQSEAIALAESHAKSQGYNTTIRKDAEKSNPNLAGSPAQIREATRKVAPSKATEWAPEIITPEVATSLSKNTVTEIGKRGSPELVDKIKKHKYDPAKNLANQSSEWIQARLNVVKNGPVGSPERIAAEKQFASLQTQLATDANFA